MNNTRHNYDYEFDIESDTAPANVVRLVGQNKSVLEIGCGPGSITKVLVQQSSCQVTGLEMDEKAIEQVLPYCTRIFQIDLNRSDWEDCLDGANGFDVVVAADVLEHLHDPWTVLGKMSSLINDDGYLVISLPHIGYAGVMACLINGEFEYRDTGLLDRTHIRFFGIKDMERLFAVANLKIVEAKYVTHLPEATEFAESWLRLPFLLRNALMKGGYSEVYQVVIKAVPSNRDVHAVPLGLPPHRKWRTPLGGVAVWKMSVGRHMRPELKKGIRKFLSVFNIKL